MSTARPPHLVTIRMGALHNDITIKGDPVVIPLPHSTKTKFNHDEYKAAQRNASAIGSALCQALGITGESTQEAPPRKRKRKSVGGTHDATQKRATRPEAVRPAGDGDGPKRRSRSRRRHGNAPASGHRES